MALTDDNTMIMPVQPMNYGNGGGFGGFGGDYMSWLLLFLVLGGGFGGFGFGGAGAMMGAGMMDGFGLYPWLNNSQNINDGFRDQMLNSNVQGIQNAVTSGFGDVQTALCGGFAGVNASINGAQSAISQQMYNNEINSLERSFAAQTASMQNANALQSQLASCCCENRAGIADLKYVVATENCADRAAANENTRDIITAINAGIQSIKDDLCAERLEAQKRENDNLRSELMYARGQASQVSQTADIINGTYTRLSQCPVNAVPVFGNTPIYVPTTTPTTGA